jgi:hypothetical protein
MNIGVGEYLKKNIPMSLEEEYEYYSNWYGDKVSYSDKGDEWYVISGTDNDEIFYYTTKIHGDIYAQIIIGYPYSNKDQCDPILTDFIDSFSFK